MTTRLVRSVAALVILTVLAIQLSDAAGSGVNVVNHISYFTFFSNIGAAAVLTSLALRPSLVLSPKFTAVRGAITLCMCITALLYGTWISPSLEGAVRHGLGPFVLLADWLLHPARRQSYKSLLRWPLLPISYFVYTLVRGSVVGWYPYQFFDPGKALGWPGVVKYGVIILFLLLAISFCLVRSTQMAPSRSVTWRGDTHANSAPQRRRDHEPGPEDLTTAGPMMDFPTSELESDTSVDSGVPG